MNGLVCLLPVRRPRPWRRRRACWPWWDRVPLPVAGGLAAGIILVLGARLGGRTTTDYMEAAVVAAMGAWTCAAPWPSASRRSRKASSAAALVGREGSMVQLGALLASVMARIMPTCP